MEKREAMEVIFGESGDGGVFVDFDNNKSLFVTTMKNGKIR